MKPNKIEEVKAEVLRHFVEAAKHIDSEKEFVSPSNKYQVHFESYRQNKPEMNWDVAKAKIYKVGEPHPFREILASSDELFFEWIEIEAKEYFLFAEDTFGGQSILDLESNILNSYSPGEDGFIMTEYHLSPKKDVLVTFGCVWGSTFYSKVFDFRNPMELPWVEIDCAAKLSEADAFGKWIDEYIIQGNDEEGNPREFNIEQECKTHFDIKPGIYS